MSVLVDDIKGSFDDIIRATDWLDSNTRESALNKLSAIRQLVGYPDWIRNDTQLDDTYNLVIIYLSIQLVIN